MAAKKIFPVFIAFTLILTVGFPIFGDDDADFLNMKKCKIDKIDDCPTGPKNKKKKDEKPAPQKTEKKKETGSKETKKATQKEISVKITGAPEGTTVEIFEMDADGKKAAECKLPCSLTLPEGKYAAKAMHADDGALISREFSVRAGNETAFELALTKFGKLSVFGRDNGLVINVSRNDGKTKTKQIPFVLDDLPCASSAIIKIAAWPFKKYFQRVYIECGKTTEVEIIPLLGLFETFPKPFVKSGTLWKAGVPQYAPQLGVSAQEAKITVVWFADLSDPISQTEKKSLDAAISRFGDKTRIIFRHYPVNMIHLPKTDGDKDGKQTPNAPILASRAAAVVMKLGGSDNFWKFLDILFENKTGWKTLKDADMKSEFSQMAQKAGVNKADFEKMIENFPGELDDQIKADIKEALGFGLTGNTIFVNGNYTIETSISSEWLPGFIERKILPSITEKSKSSATSSDIYAELTKNANEPQSLDKILASSDAGGGELTLTAPLKGNPEAKITIIQISDFQCPFCAKVEKTIDDIMRDYKGKVKLYWVNYPLPFHPLAKRAAIAAMAAGEQGKFWAMHKMLMDVQGDWAYESLAEVDKKFIEYAAAAKFDVERFKKELANPKYEDAVDAEKKKAAEMGISGTPTFLINGVKLSGAQPYEEFKKIIEQELKKSK